MKKKLALLLASAFLFSLVFSVSSCNKDASCPAYKSLHSKSGKEGLSTKKGKSNLFPKGM